MLFIHTCHCSSSSCVAMGIRDSWFRELWLEFAYCNWIVCRIWCHIDTILFMGTQYRGQSTNPTKSSTPAYCMDQYDSKLVSLCHQLYWFQLSSHLLSGCKGHWSIPQQYLYATFDLNTIVVSTCLWCSW